ncbi:MAG: class II fructose-bisphosphate aldolase [Bacillota bacterium]|mgnify:CR=1 FL=1|jgi:fructose-bisphosphate aldolase class II|nr:class II fructose-bisphosphate aldolase [Bacillota bacterium]HHT91678.1 class II fructose-bisphosphate aldolase [Bacillota bacterium]
MALVTLEEILRSTRKEKYAVGSFNAANHSMAEAILSVSEELGLPVILGLAEVQFRYVDLERFVPYLRQRIEGMATPVALHLDHGLSLETVYRGLDLGFSSVMIDASSFPYEENVALTRQVVRRARSYGASVEAELGQVGGGEGNLEQGTEADAAGYTDPSQARDFVENTGIDALAVSIGTVHGPFKGKPRLDLERLAEIRSLVEVPLVLHGGSGLSEDDFRRAVACGISKINVFTETSLGAAGALRELLAKGTPLGYPDLTTAAEKRIRDIVRGQLRVFGTPALKSV